MSCVPIDDKEACLTAVFKTGLIVRKKLDFDKEDRFTFVASKNQTFSEIRESGDDCEICNNFENILYLF